MRTSVLAMIGRKDEDGILEHLWRKTLHEVSQRIINHTHNLDVRVERHDPIILRRNRLVRRSINRCNGVKESRGLGDAGVLQFLVFFVNPAHLILEYFFDERLRSRLFVQLRLVQKVSNCAGDVSSRIDGGRLVLGGDFNVSGGGGAWPWGEFQVSGRGGFSGEITEKP